MKKEPKKYKIIKECDCEILRKEFKNKWFNENTPKECLPIMKNFFKGIRLPRHFNHFIECHNCKNFAMSLNNLGMKLDKWHEMKEKLKKNGN